MSAAVATGSTRRGGRISHAGVIAGPKSEIRVTISAAATICSRSWRGRQKGDSCTNHAFALQDQEIARAFMEYCRKKVMGGVCG